MKPRKKQDTTVQPLDVAAQINQMYPGAVTTASDPDLAVTRLPSNVLPLDSILDGGIPRGRFIEVYGSYSTLKSYWLYKALAAYQQAGKKIALIDTEHSWDPAWGISLGIDPDDMLIARPETAEQGIGILEALIRQRYDLVGFDSIAAAEPKQYATVAPGDDDAPAALARVMSRGLARLTAANKHTSVIFINQTRATIGVTFGAKSTTSGGKAMGFYASYRLSFVRTGKITENFKQWDGEKFIDSKRVVGHKIQATLEKSKLSAPHTDCHFVFDLRTGQVDETGWLIGQGIERGIIQRTTTGHHTIEGVLDKSIHGAGNFRQWVEDNPEVVTWLKEAIVPDVHLDSLMTG
jgi:recombination protein RecA